MKLIVLILIALLAYGCAAKKLAVENADGLISYQVKKRIPLYSAQKEELEKDIDQFLNQARPKAQEILPIIDELNLKETTRLDSQYAKLEAFFITLSRDFSALTSKYLAKLDVKQQKDLFETLDDENREILKREKEDRIDRIEDRFETFLGSINSAQKQLVREYADYFNTRAQKRLDRRIKLHQELRAIYDQDISEKSRFNLIQDSMVKYQEESLKGNKNLEMLKKIVPTLTRVQREYFRKEAQEVKDLLRYFNSIDY